MVEVYNPAQMSEDTGLPSTDRLLDLIDGMAERPVLMLVDMVADRFVTGAPKRISREAPVLILSYQSEIVMPGGGANAVANVAALGGRPLPLGIVGDDASGHELLADFKERGVTTDGIAVSAGYRTPTKVRILGGGRHAIKQQIVRYDIEDRIEPGAEQLRVFREALATWKGMARAGVLSDYGYGSVQPAMVELLRDALAQGGRVLCDSRHRLAEFAGIDAATPNAEEAEALLGHDLNSDFDGDGRRLRERLRCDTLLVTRGSSGMSLFVEGRSARVPVHGPTQVADVTGAGDTVIGTFALATAAGATPLEATLLANYAGGVVVMKMGTATLSREELRAAATEDASLLGKISWAPS
jgi:rfaE bifunctional protein kinase chain/domain